MNSLELKKSLLNTPGTSIQEQIDFIGMSQAELAERLGRSVPKLNELINGKAPITKETAAKLEYVLGIDASFWLNLEKHYQEELLEIEQLEFLETCNSWSIINNKLIKMNDIKDKIITVKKQTINSYVFRPMLFSTPMVQAILEGRKTQTRRIMKYQPPKGNYKFGINVTGTRCKENGLFHWVGIDEEIEYKVTDFKQPYFKCQVNIGDIIWVRETFSTGNIENGKHTGFRYKADDESFNIKWKPSLFMPKKACRLFLEITDIRIEMLNEISESDAVAEGILDMFYGKDIAGNAYFNYMDKKGGWDSVAEDAIHSYQTLWQKINGINSWSKNPFVWVYDFKVVECPEGFL